MTFCFFLSVYMLCVCSGACYSPCDCSSFSVSLSVRADCVCVCVAVTLHEIMFLCQFTICCVFYVLVSATLRVTVCLFLSKLISLCRLCVCVAMNLHMTVFFCQYTICFVYYVLVHVTPRVAVSLSQ